MPKEGMQISKLISKELVCFLAIQVIFLLHIWHDL